MIKKKRKSGRVFKTFLLIIIIAQLMRAYLYVTNDLELKPWHRVTKEKDLEFDNYETIEEYLDDELKYLERKYSEVEVFNETENYNRYQKTSQSNPEDLEYGDVNASFEMIPENIKGGVLMLHGLTDSPYAMRDIAQTFYDEGYYVLALRFPYHGTYPGEILKLKWKDFSKTAMFGAKIMKSKLEDIDDSKFYMVGYSTGATTTLQYLVKDMVDDEELLKPAGVFWLSPAMGVNPVARFAWLDILTSKIPGLSKFAWLDIYPEYDKAKYNSFAKRAGSEVYTIIKKARKNLTKLTDEEKKELPPIYAYTSIEDATVDATELFQVFKEIGNEEGELVIFDANRKYNSFYKAEIQNTDFKAGLEKMEIESSVVLVSNYREPNSEEVPIIKFKDGREVEIIKESGLKWGEETVSLAHVSLPISPSNPLYGEESPMGELNLKGEKGIIAVSSDMLLRLRYNEFFDYIEENIKEKIGE